MPDTKSESQDDGTTPVSSSVGQETAGMSPYSTGGGGVTFERRVAVKYLSLLLTGDGSPELGAGRSVVAVAFQQHQAVDDLLVTASDPSEVTASLQLSIAVRRRPKLVKSDPNSQKLVATFVRDVQHSQLDRGKPERALGLVVAGPQTHAEELETLARLADNQTDARQFFELLKTPKKFSAGMRRRLEHFRELVKHALDQTDRVTESRDAEQMTFEVLKRLRVMMPRLEAPHETDWSQISNDLRRVVRGSDLESATGLRDRLAELASTFSPSAAVVDKALVSRAAYPLVNSSSPRSPGWEALDHLATRAVESVRSEIGFGDDARRLHLDRSEVIARLFQVASESAAVVVHGESGVGKSALVVSAAVAHRAGLPDQVELLTLNLRHLPKSSLELESALGSPLPALLAEMNAPKRYLVLDGADSVSEGRLDVLRYVARAGRQEGLTILAITADDRRQFVTDALRASDLSPVDFAIPPLTDEQVAELVAGFPELKELAAHPRSRQLLRRLVVVDLLVRGGVAGVPMCDADAMAEVWSGLVRSGADLDRGTPDARELALLKLAELALTGGDPLKALQDINATALDGLRQDGLLRAPSDDPFQIGPDFAHDEIRRYAVARFLLRTADPAGALADLGAPRWALGAGQLACQAMLLQPNSGRWPFAGRFGKLQTEFDSLVSSGHGGRWGDLPGEALLTLPDPSPMLVDAWPDLSRGDAAGLQRLIRLVNQRLTDPLGLVRIDSIEPLIALLLKRPKPWAVSDSVRDLLRDWLRAHVFTGSGPGHPLRILLRQRLQEHCAAADDRFRRAATDNSGDGAEDVCGVESDDLTDFLADLHGPYRTPTIPREIKDPDVLELFALLGTDIGEDGEQVLRRVSVESPGFLSPAVAEMLTGTALASFSPSLLADLTLAYYIDTRPATSYTDDGIRDQQPRSFSVIPMAAWYRGPFYALCRSNFRIGASVINQMLNHAARRRVEDFGQLLSEEASQPEGSTAPHHHQLRIAKEPRVFVGDSHVWYWYRGTAVGPYACVSALQAIERLCDEFIEAGVPLADLVEILLDGCENLAMPGLVVGMLVRHMDSAQHLLDPYLSEPLVWHLEFERAVQETSGLAATSDGLVNADRRSWSFREVATNATLLADEERAIALKAVGDQLVEAVAVSGTSADIAQTRLWVAAFDRDLYSFQQTEDGIYLQNEPPAEIVEELEQHTEDLEGFGISLRLMRLYGFGKWTDEIGDALNEVIEDDLAAARELIMLDQSVGVEGPLHAAAATAAVAVSEHVKNALEVSNDALAFSVQLLLQVDPQPDEYPETFFDRGASRSAARVLPLLLIPANARLLALLDKTSVSAQESLVDACINLATASAHEVRQNLARSMDAVWDSACSGPRGSCHHEQAFAIVAATLQGCALGAVDPATGRRVDLPLDKPIASSIAAVADRSFYTARLDPGIRALAPASVADVCISGKAHELLLALLSAQRRSLVSHERDIDSRGTHALVTGRALLTVAASGDHELIYEQVEAYLGSSNLLGGFLRALSAAAEETEARATAARDVWPRLCARLVEKFVDGMLDFGYGHNGDRLRSAIVPNPAYENQYMYPEMHGAPIAWWRELERTKLFDAWLPIAIGSASCVDTLVHFLTTLETDEEAAAGLPWVEAIVMDDPVAIASGSFLLPSWLPEIGPTIADSGIAACWQRIVDTLVVAGVTTLAPYSE